MPLLSNVCLDDREQIGPHHLAIGKTRKIFEHDGLVHAFYSTGYAVAHAVIDGETLAVLGKETLELPVAWGGGAFCVDAREERVVLVFLHRNQHEFCFVEGRLNGGIVVWNKWRRLLIGAARLAAPWVEMTRPGTAWASVIERDGDFRLAVIAPDGSFKTGDLFGKNEKPWYHSCVQMLPVGLDKALAVGFRGAFPRETELVFKTVWADLTAGPSISLAPCNVNDRLTFHFQAAGDHDRGEAHIVYLDDGLTVSHAFFREEKWEIARNVLSFPSFAPQVSISPDGSAVLMAADYQGRLWHACFEKGSWLQPEPVEGAPAPNISALFGATGYGTGGLITAARGKDGRVPFLTAVMENDASAHARLYGAVLGLDRGLRLRRDQPLALAVSDSEVAVEIFLTGFSVGDDVRPDRSWLVVVPSANGTAWKIEVWLGKHGFKARSFWAGRDGKEDGELGEPAVELRPASGCCHAPAAIRVTAKRQRNAVLKTSEAWVEIYRREGELADLAPYAPETAAAMTLDPARIPATFKRMV